MELEELKREIARLEKLEAKGFISDKGQVKLDKYRLMLLLLITSDDKVIIDTIHTSDTIVNLKKEKEVKKEPTYFGGLFDKI